MKHLAITASLLAAVLTGCAASQNPAPSRIASPQQSTDNVTTQPSTDFATTQPSDRRRVQAVLCVQQFQLPPTTQPVLLTIPPDAKPVLSIEQTITFKTPFFVAVAQGDRRIEVDGVAHMASDGWCRLEIAYTDRDAQGDMFFSTNMLIKPGEPKALCGFPGRAIAVILFDNHNTPTTAP
jgi:hypothetical protein